jgi:hypothetical protein
MTTSREQVAPNFLSRVSDTVSLGNDRLFVVAVMLSVAPLWIGPYLPLIDLPQHAAQVTALRQLWSGDPSFNELFQVNWFTPYLLGYLLLYGLTAALPITVATTLLVSVAVAAIPALTGRLLKVAGGDEGLKWLAIPCSFSFAFYWGFLSFIVAAPLVLVFLIQTVRFVAAPTVWRAVAIACFSLLLFFCHIIVLGFASLAALAYIVGAHYRDWKTLTLRLLPYAAPVPIIGVWLAITYQTEAAVESGPIVWGSIAYRLTLLLAQPAGHEDFLSAVPSVLLVTTGVVLLPRLTGATFSRDPRRWLPFVAGLLIFLVAPHYLLGTAYFYQRLGVFLVPLWLMAWDASHLRRRLDWAAMSIVGYWVLASSARFVTFARETESFSNVVAAMEPGRRVAAMVVDNASPRFALPVYLHFPAWYQATHGGVVDFNFAEFHPQMVRYRPGVGPRISETAAWYPTAFEWDRNGGDLYDYFVVKSVVDVSAAIFKDRRSSVELVTQSGWWWVYRNVGMSVSGDGSTDDSIQR